MSDRIDALILADGRVFLVTPARPGLRVEVRLADQRPDVNAWMLAFARMRRKLAQKERPEVSPRPKVCVTADEPLPNPPSR